MSLCSRLLLNLLLNEVHKYGREVARSDGSYMFHPMGAEGKLQRLNPQAEDGGHGRTGRFVSRGGKEAEQVDISIRKEGK